jgi:threonylcarbamoyladenosine tRNA methylthiotransferase MtaB
LLLQNFTFLNIHCQVDEQIKTQRSDDLIKTGEILTEGYRKNKIGEQVSVLFEEKMELQGKEYWTGHTKEYIRVAVVSKENLTGEIADVTLQSIINREIMLATM